MTRLGKFVTFLNFVLGFWIRGVNTGKVCVFLLFLCWVFGCSVTRLGKFVIFLDFLC